MKRLFTFLVLSLFFFNWIGYQFYTAIIDQNTPHNLLTATDQRGLQEPALMTGKLPTFHISFFLKDVDSDDLLEFTSSANYSANEIFFTINNLVFDHTNKENRGASFKCFNGEYYSRLHKLFTKYPDAYFSAKIPDRYLLNIPIIFLSPKDHPPQLLG